MMLASYFAMTQDPPRGENIARLLDRAGRVRAALPVERDTLWSEGEEDFETRLDEILAVR